MPNGGYSGFKPECEYSNAKVLERRWRGRGWAIARLTHLASTASADTSALCRRIGASHIPLEPPATAAAFSRRRHPDRHAISWKSQRTAGACPGREHPLSKKGPSPVPLLRPALILRIPTRCTSKNARFWIVGSLPYMLCHLTTCASASFSGNLASVSDHLGLIEIRFRGLRCPSA